MVNSIISIITALVGVAFMLWGCYQIKTGKMVAKRSRNCVDEPRQVGILFVVIGLVAFWLAYIFGVQYVTEELGAELGIVLNIISYTAIFGVTGFMIGIGFWGLKNQRIFGIKNTPKIRKYTKRYYVAVNLALIICAAASAVLALFSGVLPTLMILFLAAVVVVAIVIVATLMTKIEHRAS